MTKNITRRWIHNSAWSSVYAEAYIAILSGVSFSGFDMGPQPPGPY